MSTLAYGPRRVSGRRIVGVPRALLAAAGIGPPARVALVVREDEGEAVVLRPVSAGGGDEHPVATISSVCQVALPTLVVSALNLSESRMVYVRAAERQGELEIVSSRRALSPGAVADGVKAGGLS